ncbi:methylaspartate mutase accessory protein GlmL [Porphyromonas pogonae]|uniref:methylaspartate mutase accessory protein GlmL n=1 Tax=Porphyromonas pogonae TaxID=867595 RepID=UPI002E792F94|nr:methylaspartate mutase accessory protein GlmL [Porphyromonas pogonae]
MRYLTVDFGSTYTKLTAIDGDKREVVGTASAFTTIDTDVMDGFNCAQKKLEDQIGIFRYDQLLCCSSAAGGLKMVALGLVPDLTAKAAKTAAASAGAKVMKTYSFEISKAEQQEIYEINPDLVLLCGGTDGGNKQVIITNARKLCEIKRPFSTIIAGNKSAMDEIEEIFAASGKDYVITDNVMPEFNKLCIDPAKECIKNLFITKIIDAKGLSRVQEMTSYKIIPTPLAVMNGCELYSKGTKTQTGHGDVMAIDIGGATTDVYSMSWGNPTIEGTMIKGIPEPYSKRTVEGDLGMRYSLKHVLDAVDTSGIALDLGVSEDDISTRVNICTAQPELLAERGSIEEKIEERLAREAVSIATQRHCGTLISVYTPMGQIYTLTGKDLMEIPGVIGIGGVLINSPNPAEILQGATYNLQTPECAKPRKPRFFLDKRYIFASMGLLCKVDPDLALHILNTEITAIE